MVAAHPFPGRAIPVWSMWSPRVSSGTEPKPFQKRGSRGSKIRSNSLTTAQNQRGPVLTLCRKPFVETRFHRTDRNNPVSFVRMPGFWWTCVTLKRSHWSLVVGHWSKAEEQDQVLQSRFWLLCDQVLP